MALSHAAAAIESVTMNVTEVDVVDDECSELQEQVQVQAEEELQDDTIDESKKSKDMPKQVVTTENGSTCGSEDEQASNEEEQPPKTKTNKKSRFIWIKRWLIDFYRTNEFLVLIVLAIIFARVYPPLGADYVVPRITSTWIAVIFIFCMYTCLI